MNEVEPVTLHFKGGRSQAIARFQVAINEEAKFFSDEFCLRVAKRIYRDCLAKHVLRPEEVERPT